MDLFLLQIKRVQNCSSFDRHKSLWYSYCLLGMINNVEDLWIHWNENEVADSFFSAICFFFVILTKFECVTQYQEICDWSMRHGWANIYYDYEKYQLETLVTAGQSWGCLLLLLIVCMQDNLVDFTNACFIRITKSPYPQLVTRET